MLPVVPLILLGGGAASLGYGVYESSKRKAEMPSGRAMAPLEGPKPAGGGGTPSAPGGLKQGTPAELSAAAQLLIQNGRDPAAMEQMASMMDQYGYTDLAQQLRARAAQLRAPAPPGPSPLPPMPVPPTPIVPPTPSTFTADMLPSGSPLLRQGSTGPDVVKWQKFLLSRGAPIGAADGIFGQNTAAGTIAFQRIANIAADGVVGPATVAAARASLGGGGLALPNVLPPSPTPSAEITATVTGTDVRVRSTPGTSSSVSAMVSAPEIVSVLNWNAGSASGYDWAQIRKSNGTQGFVAKNFLSLNAPLPPAMSGTEQMLVVGAARASKPRAARCVALSGCKLRQSPNAKSPFKTFVGNGETVLILKQHPGPKGDRRSPGVGGWSLVRYGQTTGWLPSEWLL